MSATNAEPDERRDGDEDGEEVSFPSRPLLAQSGHGAGLYTSRAGLMQPILPQPPTPLCGQMALDISMDSLPLPATSPARVLKISVQSGTSRPTTIQEHIPSPSEGTVNVDAADSEPPCPESLDEGNPKASKSEQVSPSQIMLDEWIKALKNKHSREERTMALDESGDIMHAHSITMVKRWTKEMDVLLTFVGLFSAVLTAFVVLSYQLLRPGPADPSAIVIQTPAQLVGFSCNALHQPYRFTTPTPQFAAPTYAIWLNSLWFSSLVLSLASAAMAFVVKQLLSDYSSLSSTTHETILIRQYRWNRLMRWRVPAIVTAVPSLLQVALALFLSGLIIVLWSAHPIVATVVSVIAALVLAFILGALLTSPAVSFLVGQVKWLSRRLAYQATISIQHVIQARCLASFVSLQHLERLDDNLVSIMTTIRESDRLARRGGESVAVVEQKAPLIHDTMRWAYTFSKDNKPLNHAAVCLGRFGDPALVQYYDNILRTITDRWTDNFDNWPKSTLQSYEKLAINILPIVQHLAHDRPKYCKEADKLLTRLMFRDNTDPQEVDHTLRAASLMAMAPMCSEVPLLYLFTSLDPTTGMGQRHYSTKTLLCVIQAAEFIVNQRPPLNCLDLADHSAQNAKTTTSSPNSFGSDFRRYSTAICLAIRCLGWGIDISPAEGASRAIGRVAAVLNSFADMVVSAAWKKTAYEHPDIATHFFSIVQELSSLPKHLHSRPLVTDLLLNSLESGFGLESSTLYQPAWTMSFGNDGENSAEKRRERIRKMSDAINNLRNSYKAQSDPSTRAPGGPKLSPIDPEARLADTLTTEQC